MGDFLVTKFEKMGARVKVTAGDLRRNVRSDVSIDVRRDKAGEYFDVRHRHGVHVDVLDVKPTDRHLLLMTRGHDDREPKSKFLCGHDERHWFVAPVPEARSVTTVADAMDALKPQAVVTSQREHGVKGKNWNRRHNEGFIRQGEWFFLPRPRFHPVNELMILHNEPIRRSGGSPHMVEWLYRSGGTTVYVCNQHPNGLTEPQYQAVIRQNPKATKWAWRVMQRNPQVYAMGKIRHRDHATVKLLYWHLVVMSGETRSGNVVFLD